jgi:hypothetical protein
MRSVILILVILLVGSPVSTARAFSFWAGNLQDLPHEKYFKWGINWQLPAGDRVVGASLTLFDIYNWEGEADDRLWIHLLQGASAGIQSGVDNQATGSWFAPPNYSGENILLNEFANLPEGWRNRRDVTYAFDAAEVSAFNSYLSDGNFGLGLDPDCHYYNGGVKLDVETGRIPVRAVPEAGTFILLAAGLAGMGALRLRRSAKK